MYVIRPNYSVIDIWCDWQGTYFKETPVTFYVQRRAVFVVVIGDKMWAKFST
jgi:hypothetical protein